MVAKDGEKVVGKNAELGSNSKNPEGKIIQVLGLPGEHETEIHSILAEYGLPYEFPPEVEAEADKIDRKITAAEVKKRRDMRKVLTLPLIQKMQRF